MAVLKVVYSPHQCLRKRAAEVTDVNAGIQKIVADMYETMYAEKGVGLAANQVGISLRIFVMDVSEDNNQPICAINPEVISREGEQDDAEGCLSYPGPYDNVKRSLKVRFKALDAEGKPYEMDVEGLMARCVQHEIDHLNGKLFVDHLSKLKQERARKKFEKFCRQK